MMWQCSLMARIDMEEGAVMWCVYVNGSAMKMFKLCIHTSGVSM